MTGVPTSWKVLEQADADRARAKGHMVSTYDYTAPGPGNSRGVMKVRTWVVWAKDSAGVVPADTGADPEQPHSVEGVRSGDQPGPASDS